MVWYEKMGEKGEKEWFISCEQEHTRRGESGEELTEVCDLIGTQGHDLGLFSGLMFGWL